MSWRSAACEARPGLPRGGWRESRERRRAACKRRWPASAAPPSTAERGAEPPAKVMAENFGASGSVMRGRERDCRAGPRKAADRIAAAAARLGRPGDDPNRGERLFLPECDRAAAGHLEQG